MKFLFDYLPIICFFIAYKIWGIYTATAVAIATSLAQLAIYYVRYRRFEKFHIITSAFILILGGSTLIFHKAIFIKWKPTIVYWIFGLALLASHFFQAKPLIHRMLKDKISLPAKVWSKLNLSWALFFLLLGIINLYVVYNFNTNAWVNFKLFGTLGLMIAFIIVQAIYMSRHMQQNKKMDNELNSQTKQS